MTGSPPTGVSFSVAAWGFPSTNFRARPWGWSVESMGCLVRPKKTMEKSEGSKNFKAWKKYGFNNIQLRTNEGKRGFPLCGCLVVLPFWFDGSILAKKITFTINQMKFGLVYNSFYQFFLGKYTDFPDLRESWHVFFCFSVFFSRRFSLVKRGWEPPRHTTINMDSKKTTNRSGSFFLGIFSDGNHEKNVAIISKHQLFCNCLSTHHDVARGFCDVVKSIDWVSIMSCQIQQLNFLFSPRNLGKMNPFSCAYFSDGLKPSTT